MSHEMELEDFVIEARRKVAVVEEQNELLREQNSRLTQALDDALALVRQNPRAAHRGMDEEAGEQ